MSITPYEKEHDLAGFDRVQDQVMVFGSGHRNVIDLLYQVSSPQAASKTKTTGLNA